MPLDPLAAQPIPRHLDPDADPIDRERLQKLMDMAFWHNRVGNLDAAIMACKAALSINPNSTTAHSLLGTLYEKKGDDAQAISHFEAVLALNPDSEADATKLENLRNGIHLKAVTPPLYLHWLPPALAHLSLFNPSEQIGTTEFTPRPNPASRILPLAASIAAVLLVLSVGLLAIRPQSAGHHPENSSLRMADASAPGAPPTLGTAPSPVPVVAARNSPFGTGTVEPEGGNSSSAPLVLMPHATPRTAKPAVSDPFAAPPVSNVSTVPVVPSVPRSPRHGSGRNPNTLPPLHLEASLPGDNVQGLPPAPVSLHPMATVGQMPEHVVAVSRLGGDSLSNPSPNVQIASNGSPSASSDGITPHIHITVDKPESATQVSRPTSVPSDTHVPDEDDNTNTADEFQQSAMNLQEQGLYSRATRAYQRAITLYKAEIAAGRNTDAAQRGLHACLTGLQICQQSQP